MAEPLFCAICGAEDWECGHTPVMYAGAPVDATHGPDAYCEAGACRLWLGERCEFCDDGADHG